MKNLLLSVLAIFALLGCCQRAEAIEAVKTYTKCIGGQLFAVAVVKQSSNSSTYNQSITMVQIFRHSSITGDQWPSQPIKCK